MLFKEKLKSKIKIFLDGGNGSEIAKLGGDMSPAFSALATLTSPDIVIKVHENFINAGCDIITANTFATNRHNLESLNKGDQVHKFISDSVKLSRKAISNTGKENIIALPGNGFGPSSTSGESSNVINVPLCFFKSGKKPFS